MLLHVIYFWVYNLSCAVLLSDPLGSQTFRGFFVQSRLMADDTTRVGTFTVLNPTNSRLSLCPRPEVSQQYCWQSMAF